MTPLPPLHPLALNWMITHQCTGGCAYCLADSGRAARDELGAQDRLRAVEILSSLGVRRISIMGGEPFLVRELPAVGRCAFLHGVKLNVTTSGAGCDRDRLAAMGDCLQYLNVSLDGPRDYHDRYRGRGSHRRAVAAIQLARDLSIPVRLYSVLTTENSDPAAIDWFFDTARSLAATLIMFIFLSPTGRAAGRAGLRVPLSDRDAIRSRMREASAAFGIRFKACDPYAPEEFKWFLDANGSLYKHAGGGVHEPLGDLLREPDGRAWSRLSETERERHWRSFADLLPLVDVVPPAAAAAPDGMVYVPPGVFLMGGEEMAREQPVHPVYVDGFHVDRHAVTNQLFAHFLSRRGNRVEGGTTWLDLDSPCSLIESVEGRFRAKPGFEEYPVVTVSWYGARAYARSLQKRLPTEAEWEKAARGGLERSTYPWGDDPPGERCNWRGYRGAWSGRRPDFHHGRGPLPVGLFPPNGYGLHDMAGNVWEWCEDWHDPSFYSEGSWINPLQGRPTKHKVLRGGSWSFDPDNLRVAHRSYAEPTERTGYGGFRCVLSNIERLSRELEHD